MKVFLLAALSMSCLLASPSTQAHVSAPPAPKFAVAITPDVDVAALAGPGRPSFSAPRTSSFSSRSSFTTTRPAYSSFRAAAPSRSSSTTPTYTYHATAPTAPRASTASRPAAIYHYSSTPQQAASSSGSGGLSVAEVIMLNQAMASSHTPAYPTNYASTGGYQPPASYSPPLSYATPVDRDENKWSPWAITGVVVLGIVVIAGGTYVVHQATRTA